MKKPFLQRIGGFMAGKGFYIVLFLCVAAIGISGYYLLSTLNPGEDPTAQVAATAQISIPPTPTPIPVPKPSPSPSPSLPPAPSPSPVAPSPSPSPSPKPATPAALVFTWPVKGSLDRDFSLEALAYDDTMGDWRTHSGIDIAAELGTQVLAAANGTVTATYQDDLMGETVCIDHGNGLMSYYSNLAALPTVEIGDTVETGAVIGAVGSTAIAESNRATHLHFEMEKDGVSVDPMKYLPMQG